MVMTKEGFGKLKGHIKEIFQKAKGESKENQTTSEEPVAWRTGTGTVAPV